MTVKLIKDDCLNAMKKIPDKSMDMILADLPYGITEAKWDSVIPLKPLWKQYKRIIKDHGAIALFGNEPFSSNLRISNLKMYRYDWVWTKNKGNGFLLCHKMPLKAYENISVFYKHLPVYNPQMRKGYKPYSVKGTGGYIPSSDTFYRTGSLTSLNRKYGGERYPINVIKFKKINHKGQYHPTQKPTDLLRYLVRTYTNKHMNVLDNVMGSGSTGVACKQLNRNFIGIEKDTHYFNVANLRINKTEPFKEKSENNANAE